MTARVEILSSPEGPLKLCTAYLWYGTVLVWHGCKKHCLFGLWKKDLDNRAIGNRLSDVTEDKRTKARRASGICIYPVYGMCRAIKRGRWSASMHVGKMEQWWWRKSIPWTWEDSIAAKMLRMKDWFGLGTFDQIERKGNELQARPGLQKCESYLPSSCSRLHVDEFKKSSSLPANWQSSKLTLGQDRCYMVIPLLKLELAAERIGMSLQHTIFNDYIS